MNSRIRVLLVDDSPTTLACLTSALATSDEFVVVGSLTDPEHVLSRVLAEDPDVIVMDLEMDRLDGAAVTARVMEVRATPILIVTPVPDDDGDAPFRALQAGAVDILGKDRLVGISSDPVVTNLFLRKVRVVAGVPVVGRYRPPATPPASLLDGSLPGAIGLLRARSPIRVVGLAASTGGPPALHRVLAALAPRLSVPVVVVQHMSDEFVEGFVHWLGVSVACPVVKATNMARLAPGVVHVAPGDQHLTVDAQLVTHLDLTAPLNSCRPSADRLFASLASSFGPAASGVLLTGMGRDGATGLLSMRQAGAVTIAQDETSSVVFGMPGEAIRMGGATVTLPLDRIAPALRELLPAAREVP